MSCWQGRKTSTQTNKIKCRPFGQLIVMGTRRVPVISKFQESLIDNKIASLLDNVKYWLLQHLVLSNTSFSHSILSCWNLIPPPLRPTPNSSVFRENRCPPPPKPVYGGNFSHEAVTLKIRSRSLKINKLLIMSDLYRLANLVTFHQMVHEMTCRQTLFGLILVD